MTEQGCQFCLSVFFQQPASRRFPEVSPAAYRHSNSMPARFLIALLFACALSAGTTASTVVHEYCAGCHNGVMKSVSGPAIDQFDPDHISDNPAVWARAYRELQAGTMPPVGAPRPDRATTAAALRDIEHAMGVAPGTLASTATNKEIAERLASLLWNSPPDAALLQDAQNGRLSDPAVLAREVRRMLADDRAEAFVSRFFFPWLGLDKLANADPDRRFFPDYDISLRDSLAKETTSFLLSQLRGDRDPIELWSANYTFLNEQLAKHYGVADVTGPQFRRTTWNSPERDGLLGQGSILMITSRHQHGVDAAYTTPATRAVWLRSHFLGVPPPLAFPGAQPVKPELPITPQTRTLPTQPCGNCHRNFFPLGYALENFDPIGRWRSNDQIGPVDPSGSFVDGTPTNGVVELRAALLQHSDAFRTAVTEAMITWAADGSTKPLSGTPETLRQACQILTGTPEPHWSTIIAAIAQSASR